MKEPSWTDGGATVPTIAATLATLLSAPIAGIGLLAAVFGGWIPAIIFGGAAVAMWFGGRWLIDR